MSAQARKAALTLDLPDAPLPRPLPEPDRLNVVGVSKSWNGRPILDSVDLALKPGAMAALVGVNGVGKTTLLRVLAGLITPDQGTVRLDGLEVGTRRQEYQRRLGFVSAGQTGLYARLTVQNQLEYWARIAFVPRSERRAAVERAIERFALAELAPQRVDRLSMGQRQRVRLAMGFLHDPQLLLLDEPKTSLDPDGIDILSKALSVFVAGGGTAIWCAPTADDAVLPATNVYTLGESRLVAG